MKKVFLRFVLLFLLTMMTGSGFTQNLVIVTLDGFRWQELFGGADSILLKDSRFTRQKEEMYKAFFEATPEKRREKLLPFIWGTIAKKGLILGNRWEGNKVEVKNPFWFSYPGYNEIFTGYADTLVNSNDKNPNVNESVLAYLNHRAGFQGKVAAFTSWDVFDAIFNEKKSGFLVSSGFDSLPSPLLKVPELRLLNEMQFLSPRPLGDGVRTDFMTYSIAKEYLKKFSPRILYISLDETDDFAHQGLYDQYLQSARLSDDWIADLWSTLQSLPAYKNKTTLLVTTDHGRGDVIKEEWTSHGSNIKGANEIWIAMLGPGIPARGMVAGGPTVFQQQLAATFAALLGERFISNHPVEAPIQGLQYPATTGK